MEWLSERKLIQIRDDAREGRMPDADTITQLVEQARHLDFVSMSIMFQQLHDVNTLLKDVFKTEEVPLELWGRIKRCIKYLDGTLGAGVKYKNGWPSAHVKW